MAAVDQPAAGPRTRTPRWMWVALLASLAINLMVVGVVAGSAWRVHGLFGPLGPGVSGPAIGYLGSLDKERRAEMRDAFAKERAALRPLRASVREARAEATRILLRDPVDRAALLAAELAALDAELKLRQAGARIGVQIAARLSAAEREAYLKWRESRRVRRGPPDEAEAPSPEPKSKP